MGPDSVVEEGELCSLFWSVLPSKLTPWSLVLAASSSM
jgi:hypothetical protein